MAYFSNHTLGVSAPRARPADRGTGDVPLWRRHWRTILHGCAALVLSLMLVWAWQMVRAPSTLPITEVRIEGVLQKTSPTALQARAIAAATGGFFGIDINALSRAVRAEPWVTSAAVRRVWPQGVAIAVVEHQALARWGDAALLDTHGVVFAPPLASFPSGLPGLRGPVGTEHSVMAHYSAMAALLKTQHIGIVRVLLDERRAWALDLDNGVRLLLGRGEPQAHIERFVRVWPTSLAAHAADIALIDLRYPNGFAVRWKNGAIPCAGTFCVLGNADVPAI